MISITEIPPDIYRLICGYLYFNDNQLKYVNKSTINNRDFININQKLMEERLLKLKKNYNSCKIASYFKNYLRRKTWNRIILDDSFRIRDLFITNDLRPYGFLDNFNQNTRVLIPNTAEYQPYFYRMVIYPNSDNQNQNQDKKTKKKKYKHWNYRKKKQVKDFKIKKMKVKIKSINHKKHKKSFRKR